MKFKQSGFPIDWIWQSDDILRRITQNAGWLLSGQLIAGGLSFLQIVIITQVLGAGGYGIVAVVIAYTNIVYNLVDSRLWETIIKYVPHFQEQHDDARALATIKFCYLTDFVSALIAFLILLLSAQFAAVTFIKDAGQTQLLMLFALWPLLNAPDETASAILRVADRFSWISYHRVAVAAFKVVGAILIWMLGGGIIEVLLLYLAAALVSTIISLYLANRALAVMGLDFWQDTPLKLLNGHYRELFRFTILNNFTATSQTLTVRIDTVILGIFSTPDIVGVYELAKRLVAQFNIIADPIYTSVYPEIAKLLAQRNLSRAISIQGRVSRTILLLVLFICGSVTIVSPWIVPLIFGIDFADSATLTQIMIWRLLWLVMVWFQAFMLGMGRVGQNTRLMWASSLIYVLLLLLFVPLFDAVGAAIATVLQGWTWLLFAYLTYRQFRTSAKYLKNGHHANS
ncbi:MAG: hypothetical protein CUN54_06350 [Phototrophicales bacterium]|nr:MAG: hypothetical protein CUN54_06350 [Phototrophicales bacterium]